MRAPERLDALARLRDRTARLARDEDAFDGEILARIDVLLDGGLAEIPA